MANCRKHSGLQRGQTERPPRDEGGPATASSSAIRPPPGLEQLSPVSYTRPTVSHPEPVNGKSLKTGSRLKSGIRLTFPEDQERSATSGNGRSSSGNSRGGGRSAHQGTEPRRSQGSAGNLHSDTRLPGRQGSSQPRSASSERLSDGARSDEELQQRMERLKAAQETRAWLAITGLRQMELEKERADELSRQMAMQTQALMEERARMRAEKEQLERSRNEMAARLQLLEGMMIAPDRLDAEHMPSPGELGDCGGEYE